METPTAIANQSAKIIDNVINYKRIQLATAGEIVTIISISKPAVVVENCKRKRFPTTLDNLKIYE